MYLQFQLYDNIELSFVILVTHFYSRTANQKTANKRTANERVIGQTRNENCIGF